MSAPLLEEDRRYLMQTLEEGQAFLLLDGIDELGGREARENLRSAVLDGVSRYPACRWLLTSRIVGYEEVPFDREHDRPDEGPFPDESAGELHEAFSRKGSRKLRHMRRESGSGRVAIRYIAPFDDRRIAAFARNWYVQREAATTRAEASANHLVRAVHADGSILRLARVPNLLTMMALIHRIEATLPHGRAFALRAHRGGVPGVHRQVSRHRCEPPRAAAQEGLAGPCRIRDAAPSDIRRRIG